MNTVIFDNIGINKFFKDIVVEHFATNEWLALFGQELDIAESTRENYSVFPVVVLKIVGVRASGSTVNESQYISQFTYEAETYTKNVKLMNRDNLAMTISNEIIILAQSLGKKNLLVFNDELPSPIPNTTRWKIQVDCRYNNITNKFN